MPIRNSPFTSDDSLLACRAAMLGLDLDAIENYGAETYEALTRRCAKCDLRRTCELDLRRDPNDPVWETYCPITATLIALTRAGRLLH
jgi:hypothetical protein